LVNSSDKAIEITYANKNFKQTHWDVATLKNMSAVTTQYLSALPAIARGQLK